MAEKRRYLDLWIVESNTVYQEVPYEVVTDWVQQGRLLPTDQCKPSGTRDWSPVGGSLEFEPYVPKPEPFRTEDQAEALEPIDLDFNWKRPHEEEDDEVDMIPLIDVSLVLLIFFMLTATAVGAAAFVDTPETEFGLMADNPESLRVDINVDADGSPLYSVAPGDAQAAKEDRDLRTQAEVLERLKSRLAMATTPTELVINAHKDLKAKYARQLLVALREEPYRSKLTRNFFGVSEKEP